MKRKSTLEGKNNIKEDLTNAKNIYKHAYLKHLRCDATDSEKKKDAPHQIWKTIWTSQLTSWSDLQFCRSGNPVNKQWWIPIYFVLWWRMTQSSEISTFSYLRSLTTGRHYSLKSGIKMSYHSNCTQPSYDFWASWCRSFVQHYPKLLNYSKVLAGKKSWQGSGLTCIIPNK